MKKSILIVTWLAAISWCGPAPCSSRTLTFDDVPSGTVLRNSALYQDDYRVRFLSCFRATDHVGSTWGPPVSGTNVLTCDLPVGYTPLVIFGYSTPTYRERDPVTRVGMYVSTQNGVGIQITAYNDTPFAPPLATVVLGTSGQSWTNQYVEIISSEAPFSELHFEGVNSPSDLLGFCIDDMTITYVPEPSSLLALCAGIGAMGAAIRRRQRRRQSA